VEELTLSIIQTCGGPTDSMKIVEPEEELKLSIIQTCGGPDNIKNADLWRT
jgi:hypothetical protein